MKKKQLILYLIALALIATGCRSTYNYTSRVIKIEQKNIEQEESKVDVDVDFTKTVSGESTVRESNNDARQEAFYDCIQKNKIDVVVDPIFKITRVPPFGRTNAGLNVGKYQYQAEVTGYAGYFKNNRSKISDIRLYDTLSLNNIIKFKLINDPNFSKSYFQKDIKEKIILLPAGSSLPANEKHSTEINSQPQNVTTKIKTVSIPDNNQQYLKGKRMRGAGIGLFTSGVLIAGPLGGGLVPVMEYLAPLIFCPIGGAMLISGIGLWAGGNSKMKKASRYQEVSFNYNIKPDRLSLTLNF